MAIGNQKNENEKYNVLSTKITPEMAEVLGDPLLESILTALLVRGLGVGPSSLVDGSVTLVTQCLKV